MSPARTAEDVADLVEALRRQTKHGPARLAADLQRRHGITLAPATVHCVLVRRGLNRLRDLDPPTGERLREVIRYEHDQPGDMVHVDIKKLGRTPAGGGWRMHGLGTDAARASKRAGPGTGKVGYIYLHSAVDDHSRLAYTEALEDERAATAAAFWHRAASWADAVAATGTKRKRTRPYTPRTNGKVERYNGTLAREWAYVRDYTSEHERRVALADFLNYYNHERPHSSLGGKPPISRTPASGYRVTRGHLPQPPAVVPQQLTIEDAMEPTS